MKYFILIVFILSSISMLAQSFSKKTHKKAVKLAQSNIITDGHVDLPYRLKTQNFRLEREDILLAYTDGVIDAQNKSGETFSKHRLNKLLSNPYPSAQAMTDAISVQIKAHISNQDQFDDITILALRRKKA